MKEYLYWAIAVFVIISTQLKAYFDLSEKKTPIKQKIVELLYGTAGSVITLFVVYEGGVYFGLNERFAIVCGAGLAYLGGESVKALLTKYINKKIESL